MPQKFMLTIDPSQLRKADMIANLRPLVRQNHRDFLSKFMRSTMGLERRIRGLQEKPGAREFMEQFTVW